ncbi:MAG: hypothetical protein KAQ69_06480 [Spirochaetales bacterium]|nr:hypothetical protein [Spirochaetales bacterium]
MIKYFRKKKRRDEIAEDYILVTFHNKRPNRVVVRSEDDGFDYIRTFDIDAGETINEQMKKGAHICVWEINQIVGEYTIKMDRDDDIEIMIT